MTKKYEELVNDAKRLAALLPKDKYTSVYGIPSGGILPAFVVSCELNIPLITEDFISPSTLLVDDLIDSGRTIEHFKNLTKAEHAAVLYKKPHSPAVEYCLEDIGKEWISLPHERGGERAVEDNIVRLLEYLGEDPTREGLQDTPKRVIKSYKDLFSGYKKNVKDILTTFDSEEYDEMVLLKDIEFYSTCEHHMLPFFGKAHVAYIPNKKIVGLSKLARIVEIFSRRLQNQERLTKQVAEALEEELSPLGVAVVMEGEHFCMKARGVNKQNSVMKTAALTGVFRNDNNNARQEFYNLIK